MVKSDIIKEVEEHAKAFHEKDSTGHDWQHIQRVRNNAMSIAVKEKANLFIVEIAALAHDLADHKLVENVEKSEKELAQFLLNKGIVQEEVTAILNIIKNVSFKGAEVGDAVMSLEGKIVQDADRLDAIGAIGVARAFAYGGSHGRALYVSGEKAEMHESFEAYQTSKGHTINHFHEKLLLLKDRIHTDAAKEIAIQRHEFMEQYLTQFMMEWEGA